MFFKTVHKRSIINIGLIAAVTAAGGALLVWPQAVATGVSRGLSICGSVMIPSLFPFLVLAGFIVRSGMSGTLGRRLERPTRFLFGLPGCCGAAILVSMIGGYPAGGVAIRELLEQKAITEAQARRMLRFCVNGGPAFVVSAVGAGLLGSVQKGLMLFAAQITASLLLGVAGRRKLEKELPQVKVKAKHVPAAAAFVESVNGACRSLLYICGFVVLFAAALSLGDASGFSGTFTHVAAVPLRWVGMGDAAPSVLPILSEVSCGSVEAAGAGIWAPFLLGATLGWGGLSVHCQLAATLQGHRVMGRGFFAVRAFHALLGGGLSVILFRFAPMTTPAFIPNTPVVFQPFSTSAAASVALLLMCGAMILAEPSRDNAHRMG